MGSRHQDQPGSTTLGAETRELLAEIADLPMQTRDLPSEFDGLRIVRPLGRGGSGDVYLAEEVALGRRVAVKFLRHRSTWNWLSEARTIAGLRHPGIVALHRIGEVDGRAYIVCEHVSGGPLSEAQMPMPYWRMAPIARGLAAAIAAVHGAGLVHGDIKPGNVVLAPDPLRAHREIPKLIDFGIAHHIGDETGNGAGTPAYLAPERAENGSPSTTASDVYALGLVCFEMLTGTIDRTLATRWYRGDRPPAPGVPEPVMDVIGRMLSPAPGPRISALEAVAVFDRHQPAPPAADETAEVGPPSATVPRLVDGTLPAESRETAGRRTVHESRDSSTWDLARRGAEVLIHDCLRVAAKERVVVFQLEAAAALEVLVPVLQNCGADTVIVDARPLMEVPSPHEQRRRVIEQLRGATASLYVSGDDVPPDHWGQQLIEVLEGTRVRHVHAPQLSPRTLSTSVRVDPQRLSQIHDRLRARLERGREVTVTSPAGTSLTVALHERWPIVADDGVPRAGSWSPSPSGSLSWYSPIVAGTYVADRNVVGSHIRDAAGAARNAITFRFADGEVIEHHAARPSADRDMTGHFGSSPHAARVGVVSITTNYLARAELRSFAHDAILPGLRLQLGYADPRRTRAPHSAAAWALLLGRRQTVWVDGDVIIRDGRLESRWVDGIVPF